MYLDICTAHSVRKKNDLIIETGWDVTLVNRPFAAPLSDRKKNPVECTQKWYRSCSKVSYVFVKKTSSNSIDHALEFD